MSGATRDAVAFAERLLVLLDEGRFTATYKFAVLLGLTDLCFELFARGVPPDMVTTRQLAEKVVDLYWPQTQPYVFEGGVTRVLKQNAGSQDSQAEIVAHVARFRAALAGDRTLTPRRARRLHPGPFEDLVRQVEWKLIQMPLPRLQRAGGRDDPFLYRINWDENVRAGAIKTYQRADEGGEGAFDNRILLLPGVGEHLIRLAPLLRPFIQQQWARKVAQVNPVPDGNLERFLFGTERVSLEPVRAGLIEVQDGLCFYCRAPLRGAVHVDHFIPWARHPDDGIENLVAAHERCNLAKRDFLAAADHVEAWMLRAHRGDGTRSLQQIADAVGWPQDPTRTYNSAAAIYGALPDDARVWLRGAELSRFERRRVLDALAVTGA